MVLPLFLLDLQLLLCFFLALLGRLADSLNQLRLCLRFVDVNLIFFYPHLCLQAWNFLFWGTSNQLQLCLTVFNEFGHVVLFLSKLSHICKTHLIAHNIYETVLTKVPFTKFKNLVRPISHLRQLRNNLLNTHISQGIVRRTQFFVFKDPGRHVFVWFYHFCQSVFRLHFQLIYFLINDSDSFSRKSLQRVKEVNGQSLIWVQILII